MTMEETISKLELVGVATCMGAGHRNATGRSIHDRKACAVPHLRKVRAIFGSVVNQLVAVGFALGASLFVAGCAQKGSSAVADVPVSGESAATAKDPQLRRQVVDQVRADVKNRLPYCDRLDFIKATSPMYQGETRSVAVFGRPPFDPNIVPREEDEHWQVGACGQELKMLVTFVIAKQGTTFTLRPLAAHPLMRPSRPEAAEEPKDLVLDFGGGDSIRLVGQGDNFRCDDPAYAHVEKVETTSLAMADGAVQLCKPKDRSR